MHDADAEALSAAVSELTACGALAELEDAVAAAEMEAMRLIAGGGGTGRAAAGEVVLACYEPLSGFLAAPLLLPGVATAASVADIGAGSKDDARVPRSYRYAALSAAAAVRTGAARAACATEGASAPEEIVTSVAVPARAHALLHSRLDRCGRETYVMGSSAAPAGVRMAVAAVRARRALKSV